MLNKKKVYPDTAADVCLVLEGTYPYVGGGVSTWVHDLIRFQPDVSFHLLCLTPHRSNEAPVYNVPKNVIGATRVAMQDMPFGRRRLSRNSDFFRQLEPLLIDLQSDANITAYERILDLFAAHRHQLGEAILIRSREAWAMIQNIYEETQSESPFLEFYWTWRALFSAFFATLLAPVPPARVYHTASTGYAGIYTARAAIETGSPGLVTEHGIYTNERRVEISLADWIYQAPPNSLDLGAQPRGLKDMWKETFASYSRICYASCRDILTIFEGNQAWQRADGADPQKMRVIPNGIEIERFAQIKRQADRPPTVAMIGRIVPIKDIKTFLRACRTLKVRIPTLQALVVGPSDEDPDYNASCRRFVQDNGLSDTVEFTGRRKIEEVLAEVDVCVLTSISEGQPLVILEAGAAGVPFVATDVGACRELIHGRGDEDPNLGQGGVVTPVANPTATAAAIERLLTEPGFAHACGETMRRRVARYYDKNELIKTYRNLYDGKADGATADTHRHRYIWDATGDA